MIQSCTFPMTSDLDLYRTANLLIKQHGSQAQIEAAQRADKLLEDGDLEGSATYRKVIKAIQELQRDRRPGEAIN